MIAAAGPEQCLELVERRSEPVDLLLTDVIMPKMDGRALHNILHEQWKTLPVLYMSGYSTNIIAHHGVLDAGIHLIEKPLSVGALRDQILLVLGRNS